MYLKFPFWIISLSIKVLEESAYLLLPYDHPGGEAKNQNSPSGHLLKAIIRSSESDLILPSARLRSCHKSNCMYCNKASPLCAPLSSPMYGNRDRASHAGQAFCLHVTYHTLPLTLDQRGRLSCDNQHTPFLLSPPPPCRPSEMFPGRSG